MDYSAEEKPVMITRDYVGPVQHHAVCRDDYFKKPGRGGVERRFGEADHALPFWCRVFAYRPKIYVLSVDSDTLANMATYVSTSDIDLLDNEPALALFREVLQGTTGLKSTDISRVVGEFLGHHKQLIWVRPDFRPPNKRARIPFEQVDMLELYHKLLYKEMKERFPERKSLGEGGAVNCTLMQFLLMCAANGTDYVEKKRITPGIGPDKVISMVLKHETRYRINLYGLRGDECQRIHLPLAEGLVQALPGGQLIQGLFPRGDYDLKYCNESWPGCLHLLYQHDPGSPHGMKEPEPPAKLFGNRVMFLYPEFAFQLAYWLVDYNLFVPRKTGDPVARYARITAAAAGREKRKRDEDANSSSEPLKRHKALVHTACGDDIEKMPHPECDLCMALLGFTN